MPDNSQKLQLIQAIRQSGFPGSATDVFSAYDQGRDLIGEFVAQQQQQQEQQEQQQSQQQGNQGMAQGGPPQPPPMNRPDGRVSQPNVNQPVDNNQGHLVQAGDTQNVGIQDLPTGPAQSQMIQARKGGVKKYRAGGIKKAKPYISKYEHGGVHINGNLGGSKYAFGLGTNTNTSIMDRYFADQPGIGQMDFSNTGNLLQSNREYNSALQAQERQNQRFQTGINEGGFDNAFSQAQQYYPGGEDFSWKGNQFKNERVSSKSI